MTIMDELLKTLESIETNHIAIGEARLFLDLLLEKGFLNKNKPQLSLMDDGEVNFWWNLPEARLDIGFYGTGIYSYYAEIKDQEYGAELKRFDDVRLDQELLNILKQIGEKNKMDEQIETKTFTLSQDLLERHEPDPLEAKLLSPEGKEALMMARAIIFVAPMMRFNPREYRIKIVYEAHTNSFRAYCTPQEAAIMMLKPLPESELLESYLEWEKKEKEKGKVYPRPVENYYGFITPRAKFRNIDEALCGSAMKINF